MTLATLTQKIAFATGAIAAAGFVATAPAHAAALVQGDLAFTAFNTGEDGWSLTSFKNIDPNTTIYFSDNEATSTTAFNTGESFFKWVTGPGILTRWSKTPYSSVGSIRNRIMLKILFDSGSEFL
jgi:hypothetical protein